MSKLHVAFRCVAGLVGALLGIWGCFGAFQTVRSYRYASLIDVLPRFTLSAEIGKWFGVVALSLGAFLLLRFALRSTRRDGRVKPRRSLL
jgi:hypothetical protein